MPARSPIRALETHEVTNQPGPIPDYDAAERDLALEESFLRQGGTPHRETLRLFGAAAGGEEMIEWGRLANRHPPELHAFDRFGGRIDEVHFHPSYHRLMGAAADHQIHSIAWTAPRGGHVAHAALLYLLAQVETGVCCPISMTYAAVPSLDRQPEIAQQWRSGLLSKAYDPRCLPAPEKSGLTIGMAMTEKQGGSDVRANSTRAQPCGRGGAGGEYRLTGHKWFCSAPMSDAFLSLAQSANGLSCFLVPRWTPEGRRNRFFIQRLKDKLGNRSNASSEIEYRDTLAWMIGPEGQGVRTIIEMVHHTRLDAAAAPAGLMRQALVQAIHHCRRRKAFGRRLIEQPLMRNVLADMAIECEAATALFMRVAGAFDRSGQDEDEKALARIAVAIAKYWINKRAPGMICEALECLGGAGYVEESILPRLYREAPLNGIWEGSGNVICLDVLRTMKRYPESLDALLAEIRRAGGNAAPQGIADRVRGWLRDEDQLPYLGRRLVEELAIGLQASLLARHSPAEIADAFSATRLTGDWGRAYGTLPLGTPVGRILARAWPDAG